MPGERKPEAEETKVIEVTTYRLEGRYTDKRHPDEVRFAKTIEEDLARRDFTVNAIALALTNNKKPITNNSDALSVISHKLSLVDPFRGQEDLKKKLIRAVGEPAERFGEDALRLLRAVRLAVELSGFSAKGGPASGWKIEKETAAAIAKLAGTIEAIAKERVRDELIKLIMAPEAARGIRALEEVGLLRFIIPELREGIRCGQNKHHIYTVFDHNVRALDYAVKKDYSLVVRLASLLHDVGKPRTKAGEGPDSTFYNHEMVGARMTAEIMDRLKFPKTLAEAVIHLVRYHLFYYNVGEVTAAGVRRFLARVGPETVPDLLKVREADRIGSGVPKAFPYKLRHLLFMIEKVKHDPVHPKMLAVRGDDVMKILAVPAGPKIGQILAILLEEVLDDPSRNAKEYLEPRVRELGALSEGELQTLADAARGRKEEFERGIEGEMKKRHHVE